MYIKFLNVNHVCIKINISDTVNLKLGPEDEIPIEDGVCYVINRTCAGEERSIFRTISGSCNNNKNESSRNWGTAGRGFQRRVPANYADGWCIP